MNEQTMKMKYADPRVRHMITSYFKLLYELLNEVLDKKNLEDNVEPSEVLSKMDNAYILFQFMIEGESLLKKAAPQEHVDLINNVIQDIEKTNEELGREVSLKVQKQDI